MTAMCPTAMRLGMLGKLAAFTRGAVHDGGEVGEEVQQVGVGAGGVAQGGEPGGQAVLQQVEGLGLGGVGAVAQGGQEEGVGARAGGAQRVHQPLQRHQHLRHRTSVRECVSIFQVGLALTPRTTGKT